MIDQTFPAGRFVAIYEGRVVADAEDLDALMAKLLEAGIDPKFAIAVQANEDYPRYGVIL